MMSIVNRGRRNSEATSSSSDKSISEDNVKSLTSWFLSNQTTSNKRPDEIIKEAMRVLRDLDIHHVLDGFCIECCHDPDLSEIEFQSYQNSHARRGSAMAIPPQLSKNSLVFRLEVGKVPRISMHGVAFKRISGGVWLYNCLLYTSPSPRD